METLKQDMIKRRKICNKRLYVDKEIWTDSSAKRGKLDMEIKRTRK